MPFDNVENTRLGRLLRLRGHLDKATDREQGSFCMCLLHRASEDPVFIAQGLDLPALRAYKGGPSAEFKSFEALMAATKFFGEESINLFGAHSVSFKCVLLGRLIEKEMAHVL